MSLNIAICIIHRLYFNNIISINILLNNKFIGKREFNQIKVAIKKWNEFIVYSSINWVNHKQEGDLLFMIYFIYL